MYYIILVKDSLHLTNSSRFDPEPEVDKEKPWTIQSWLYDVPVGFVTHPSNLRLCIALCAVAEG